MLSPLLYQHITGVIFEKIVQSKVTPAFSLSGNPDSRDAGIMLE